MAQAGGQEPLHRRPAPGGRETPLPEDSAAFSHIWLRDEGAEVALERVVARTAVAEVISPLQSRDQRLLVSHHVEGVPISELATTWGMTPGAMGVALHRARHRARARSRPGLFGGVPPLGIWLRERLASWERFLLGGDAAVCSTIQAMAQLIMAVALVGATALSATAVSASMLPEAEIPSAPSQAFAETRASDPLPPAPVAEVPASPGEPVPAPAPPQDEGGHQVELAPVVVPGTEVTIAHEPPADPQTRVGIAPPGGPVPEVAVEVHDSPTTHPVESAGCDAVGGTDTVVYCEQ
jgi:hypothetical protein